MTKQSHLKIVGALIGISLWLAPRAMAQPICPLDTLKPKKVSSLETFHKIPVLNDGRIKPMESFAENFLLRISGRRSFEQETAPAWLARFLFAPRSTYEDKVFLINNPEILEAIRVEPETKRRYSYSQLESGYDKLKELAEVVEKIDQKERSVVEEEILRIYSNLYYYIRLSGALAYAFPHPDFEQLSPALKATLQLPDHQDKFSFYDMFNVTEQLHRASASLLSKSQEAWNEDEARLAQLINAMFFWTEHYANAPLGLIPTMSHEDESWAAPMDIIRLNIDQAAYFDEITHVRNMTVHYWNGSQLEFDLSARAFADSVQKRLSPKEKEQVGRIPLELLYNKLDLFVWAKLCYGLGFIFVLLSLLSDKNIFYKITSGLTLLGFIPHFFAIILRIMIMARPPVSNLYETFIFVGLVSVILGFILEAVNKNRLGITVANTCGLIFLLIAAKFAAEGDTLRVLVAVLDSNFWLSTHVLSITTGYAGSCVAAIMGHIYIIQACFDPENKKRLDVTYRNMVGILGFGLTVTFLGTTLGGIWADQSWGRFWGWDPKENGALLIILWAAILFHARLAKIIHPLGMATGCVLCGMVVMWAWFGVNLLSVGLHSYGFTSGIANALMIYVLLDLAFLTTALIYLGKRNIKI